VLGFLVVSGYSIAHSLHKRPAGFYKRRLLRIYPLYVTSVIFSLLPFTTGAEAIRGPGFWIWRPQTWVVVGNLLMLQNLVVPPIESNVLVWTLGIEVICYLLTPLFRKLPDWPLLLLTGISAAAYAMFPHMNLPHYATLRFGLPLLLFAWAWLIGFLMHRHRRFILLGGIIATSLGLGVMLLNTSYNTQYSLHTFAGSVLIVVVAGFISLPVRLGAVLNYLGDLSYPIYLLHLPSFLFAY